MAATRVSYDAVAAAYAEGLSDELRRKPLDRALLAAFAEQVREAARDSRGGLLLLAVHAGEEVRHSAEWFGAEVDVSFRFFDPAWLSAELERAGFTVESLTRRQPYPGAEIATPRAYFLARALSFSGR
jgi:hypothetical protein